MTKGRGVGSTRLRHPPVAAMMATLARLMWAVLPAVVSACVPPDCDRKDCGTCGVACCALLVQVEVEQEHLMHALNASLASGGPDGRFFLKPTAESPFGESRFKWGNLHCDRTGCFRPRHP